MALSYNLAYQKIISVHPTRRQIFAGKTDSTFWNIWQWVICRQAKSGFFRISVPNLYSSKSKVQSLGERGPGTWIAYTPECMHLCASVRKCAQVCAGCKRTGRRGDNARDWTCATTNMGFSLKTHSYCGRWGSQLDDWLCSMHCQQVWIIALTSSKMNSEKYFRAY